MQLASFPAKDPLHQETGCIIGKSKERRIKQGTTSGRWYKARVLSQEGAICVIDIGTTVLRVSQSKLRQEKGAWNDAASSPDHPQPPPPSASAPRERLDLPRERAIDQLPGQGAPEVYRTAPRGVRLDVMELSDRSGAIWPRALNMVSGLGLV